MTARARQAAAKAAEKDKPPVEETKPAVEDKAADTKPAAADETAAQDAESADNGADKPPAEDPAEDEAADDLGADGDDVPPDMGLVDEPCRKHFPEGWPVQEEGAYVNCPHGHGIRYGDQIEITRERAHELGFLTDGE